MFHQNPYGNTYDDNNPDLSRITISCLRTPGFTGIRKGMVIHMIKKEKPEIKTMDDVRLLPREEQTKWEIANELGYFDKIVASGWKSLTSRENGRIGGVLSARAKKKESVNSTKNEPEHGK